MRVFTTGIDGFVGRHLAEALRREGHETHGSTLDGARPKGVERVWQCDVTNADRVDAVLDEARPDAVVHLAGQSSGAAAWQRPAETFRINALGTLHVLEACRRIEPGVVLLVTSSEVYGEGAPGPGPVDEATPLAAITPYGVSKVAQDALGLQYARGHGLPVIRVRSFPHTGPGQDARFVFGAVARRIALAEKKRGSDTIELGWLGAVRDLSDVRDVARAYVRLLQKGTAGEAYNVCRGEGRTIRSALEDMVAESRCPIRLQAGSAPRRPADVRWMVGDPSKIARATGWRAERPWADTARDLLESWRRTVAEDEGDST